MPLTAEDLDSVCGLVSDLCGIYLDESKGYLIESRLGDLVRRTGCESYAALARRARLAASDDLRTEIINQITTNETLFFRDSSTFEALQHKVLPELIDSKAGSLFPRRLRIWSAACSTGQETYSVGITIHELLGDVAPWDIQILGTDICDEAVARASYGLYSEHETSRGLSPERRSRYFRPHSGGWRVTDSLRSLACFERRNLLESLGSSRFDIIFCRNVAIYFTPEDRRDLFARLTEALTPEGYLFVGGQESLTDLGPRFAPHRHCRAVFYRPNLATTAVCGSL
jgi:chemotaxis protein methyltransferase CheR